MVMGNFPSDYDITTSATPEEVMAVLEASHIRTVPTGIRHGTVTAVTDGNDLEITTYRVDGDYADHRRPDSVSFSRSIEEDVKRRDFTINAMYLDNDGNVIDLVGGREDIKAGIIRAVGDPYVRFEEDALRIMRGLRFAAVTGFEIEEKTYEAMINKAPLISGVSGERIAVELNGIVTAPFASGVIRRSVPVLKHIIPELEECVGFDQRSPYHDRDVLEHTLAVLDGIPCVNGGKRDLTLALAALLHDIAKPQCFKIGSSGRGNMIGHPVKGSVIADRVMTDLHYPNSLRIETVKLVRFHDMYVDPDRISVHRVMCECGKDIMFKLAILQRADILAHSDYGIKRLEHLEQLVVIGRDLATEGAAFSINELKVSGRDVTDLGVPPGPKVGEILRRLFEEHIMDIVPNDRDKLLERLKFIIC